MRKATRKTVLLCCEGKANQTFVAYLRSIYTARRPGAPYAMLALLDSIRIGGGTGKRVCQRFVNQHGETPFKLTVKCRSRWW